MPFLAKPCARENFLVRLARVGIRTPLGAILSISNKRCIGKSSSKAQIAAYLLMILAMAERGGFEPPVEVLAPTTV